MEFLGMCSYACILIIRLSSSGFLDRNAQDVPQ